MQPARTVSFLLAACALLGFACTQESPAPTQTPTKPAAAPVSATPPPPQAVPAPSPTPAAAPAAAPAQVPEPAPVQKSAPAPARSPQRLAPGESVRIGTLPGIDKDKNAKNYESLCKWLSTDLARPVEIVQVNDFTAGVKSLLENKVEMAWLDGQATIRAETESKGFCWSMFAREEDFKRTSYFIANKKLVDAGTFTAIAEKKPMTTEQLAQLKPKFAGLTFTFGAKSSTTAHLMPRYFLERPEVAVDPEKNFKAAPAYAANSDAASVIASVGSGAVDLGVVDAASWEKASDEQKAQAPVIYVTPEYLDENMVLYNRVGPTLSFRLVSAFVRLEKAEPKSDEQKAVLEMFRTQRFIQVIPDKLAALREIVKSARERHLID